MPLTANEIRKLRAEKIRSYHKCQKHADKVIKMFDALSDEFTVSNYYNVEKLKQDWKYRKKMANQKTKFPYIVTQCCEVCERPYAEHFDFDLDKPIKIQLGQCKECFRYLKSAMMDFNLITNSTIQYSLALTAVINYEDPTIIKKLYRF